MAIRQKLLLITFDATGTLLKFRKPPAEIYLEIASTHGIHADEEQLKKSFRTQWNLLNKSEPHFGTCWESWWTKFVVGTFLGSGIPEKSRNQLHTIAAELIEHFRTTKCWDLKPNAEELLKNLKVQPSLHLGVISNFDPRLREILRQLEISQYFDFLVLSHEIRASKPQKEIFNKALELSKIDDADADKCLHVGDNYELDYLGASNAGWRGALITPPSEDPHLEENCRFDSLADLNKYLIP